MHATFSGPKSACAASPRRGEAKRSRKSKSSSQAQRLLRPTDIVANLPKSDLTNSWDWFRQQLNAAGFESTGFLIHRRDVESPLGHDESHLFGEVVSKDYLSTVMNDPNLQANARPYRRLRQSKSAITFLKNEDLADSSPAERDLAIKVNHEFHIKGWALFPTHAPEKNRIYSLGWWDLNNQGDAQKLWAAESSTFTLAATYFCESIAVLIDREITGETSPALSQRELECLLWAGAGKTTSEISTILNVADGTIDEYIKRAARKLGATTRAQACVRAILLGLISP